MEPPACALCGQSTFLEPPNLERAAALAERLLDAIAAESCAIASELASIEDRHGRRVVRDAARAAIARTLLEAGRIDRAAENMLSKLEELAAAGDSDAYAAELERLEGLAGERWEPLELFDDPGEKPGEPPAHRGRT